eukprot:1755003-Pleurochrysis_carterae.AAC.1
MQLEGVGGLYDRNSALASGKAVGQRGTTPTRQTMNVCVPRMEQVERARAQSDLHHEHERLVDKERERDVALAALGAVLELRVDETLAHEVHVRVVAADVDSHAPAHRKGRDGRGEENVRRPEENVERKGEGEDGNHHQQQERDHVCQLRASRGRESRRAGVRS